MRAILLCGAAVLALAGQSSAAQAQDSIEWSKVGDWQVLVDRTLGNGCFAVAFYEGGIALRVGIDPQENTGYVLFGSSDWRSLEAGKSYDIEMQFDWREPWIVEASAQDMHGTPSLTALVDAAWFDEFAKSQEIAVKYRRREVARLRLTGSRAAVDEMLACQEAMNGTMAPADDGSDPFSVSPTEHDPFA